MLSVVRKRGLDKRCAAMLCVSGFGVKAVPALIWTRLVDEPPTKDWRTDAQLIDAINRADASAFETLYYRYRDWVLRLAYRFTADHEDALDVLQETFAYLVKRSPGLKLTAKMTTFLYPVVKNISLTILRKNRAAERAKRRDEKSLTAPPTTQGFSEADLASVLGALPEPRREVLLMRFLDGLTLDEIAQALQIPVGTVKSRLHHALTSLRNDERARRYFEH